MNKKSKFTSPIKHIEINDEGIGSNRIIINNNYLNNYNYFNKNNIKMLEIRKKKYLYNKFKLEEFKKEKSIPELAYTTSLYMYYNKSNNNYTKNIKNKSYNNAFKKLEINYPQDSNQNNDYDYNYNSGKNQIRKTYKVYDDLINDLNKKNKIKKENNETHNNNQNNKNHLTNYTYQDKNYFNNELSDEKYDYIFNERNRYNNIKCKVIFGKTLSSDYRKRFMTYNNNKKNKYNFNKNKTFNNNKMKLKKELENSEYHKYISTKRNSDKNKYNNDLNNISSIYGKEIIENNENNHLIKDNLNKNKVLPLIK